MKGCLPSSGGRLQTPNSFPRPLTIVDSPPEFSTSDPDRISRTLRPRIEREGDSSGGGCSGALLSWGLGEFRASSAIIHFTVDSSRQTINPRVMKGIIYYYSMRGTSVAAVRSLTPNSNVHWWGQKAGGGSIPTSNLWIPTGYFTIQLNSATVYPETSTD